MRHGAPLSLAAQPKTPLHPTLTSSSPLLRHCEPLTRVYRSGGQTTLSPSSQVRSAQPKPMRPDAPGQRGDMASSYQRLPARHQMCPTRTVGGEVYDDTIQYPS